MTINPSPGFLTKNETQVKLPRPTRVKNKTPAQIQITAEQLLHEAREQQEAEIRPPKQEIIDAEELDEYGHRKRKEFEDLIRRVRWNTSVWVKYAQWEEMQGDFARARSVWERALEADNYRNTTLWLKYVEMEMKHRFVNHARNVWDRAISLLPRVDKLWYKYIHMEEILGDGARARQIFERWMAWEPDHQGWSAYIKFELRYKEIERARGIFERYVRCHPTVKAWIRYAKFEVQNGEVAKGRSCYERAVEELGEDGQTQELFVAFAEFEEKFKELERARAIYKYALDHIPKGQAEDLYKKFVHFERQYGDRAGIEDVIVGKRRFQYEEEVKRNPLSYDAWFDYVRLEESVGDKDRIRDLYDRGIACVPRAEEKRYWQRYIYLWINYALFEELEAKDDEKTRKVYRQCLNKIPHKRFSFAKVWLMAAQFEVRRMNLPGARQLLRTAIERAPKHKIFKTYIEIELQLGNIERCRKVYKKYLTWAPANCNVWIKYAELEVSLRETERGRSIFEFAISQPVLDMPEVLWKAYIEFEISEGEHELTRGLYERLLDRTKNLKVWVSFAKFEAGVPLEEKTQAQAEEREPDPAVLEEQAEDRCIRSRRVFERAFQYFRNSVPQDKEERAILLQEWQEMEKCFEEFGDVASVQKKMPRRVKRKRPLLSEDEPLAGFTEYIDYIFPEDVSMAPNLKILEAARQWKRQRLALGEED